MHDGDLLVLDGFPRECFCEFSFITFRIRYKILLSRICWKKARAHEENELTSGALALIILLFADLRIGEIRVQTY